MKARRERERETKTETERDVRLLQLAMMPDHACVVERRFFANDSLLKCRRSRSHGCFALLSMHRVFSTELSIALTDAEDFFKMHTSSRLVGDRSIDRLREGERERELFLGKTVQLLEHVWRPPVVFSRLFEYACRKNLWASSCSFLRSLLFKMRQESAALQESGNLEVDRKLPSTLQTQHQLRACTLAGSVAQSPSRSQKEETEERRRIRIRRSRSKKKKKKRRRRSIFFAETKVDSQRLRRHS